MSELTQIKKQINRYRNRMGEDEFHELIFKLYDLLGLSGMKEFIDDFNKHGKRFPLSKSHSERIALIEKNVTTFLPRKKYPWITNALRRKIYESKNRGLLINKIIKGEKVKA